MQTKRFKYQHFLDEFKNCPPEFYREKEIIAYRWVFEKCDAKSFVPIKIINPARRFNNNNQDCMGFGLSLFEEFDGAREKYIFQVDDRPQLRKKLGDRIAEISLLEKDGVCSEPDKKNYSHFTFHPYSDVDLTKKILNIADIFDDNGSFAR